MPRAATTLDVFNAIAEPRRRQILDCLAPGEQDVSAIIHTLGWPQAQVSKHLAVLRSVHLVNVRAEGRRRLYSVNGQSLKPIHTWAATFERYWTQHLDRIKRRAEEAAKKESSK